MTVYRKSIKRTTYFIGGITVLYIIVVLVFYLNQNRFGFNPRKLTPDHVFQCDRDFEEMTITSFDGTKLHGVMVKTDSAKGLILFLHGAGGSIDKYMDDAPLYADFGYDVFYLDYRGYGKSEGEQINEKQFTNDLDEVYAYLKQEYEEKNIVIVGFSMGTFAGSYLATQNNPRLLILNDPPYWILEQFIDKFWFLPVDQLAKFRFETYEYVEASKVPILLFLGGKSELSKETRWQQHLGPEDSLIIVEKGGHQDFIGKEPYMTILKKKL
jgi:pimeloyl-ACP methyl ester carboxylesterase